ncbi:MAG: hypothetical protein IPM55_14555 [Acidobacteria bacterium]|nr:hypothetical protein [Acidobacteriota bacterium]
MKDYVYPSIYFAYFYFLILLVGAIYFMVRSIKHGYWGSKSEEPKYRMLRDDDEPED